MGQIDLFHPDHYADPYPTYARMRQEHPAYWDDRAQRWFITRYADVAALTGHPGISAARIPSAARLEAMGLGVMEPVYAFIRRQMNFIDTPDHARIRGLVHKAFTPAAIAALRAHIQEICESVLDAAGSGGSMDLMKDFAYPLPAIVIAEMLGVPPEDRDQFKQWSADFAEIVGNPIRPMERLLEIKKSVLELIDYLRGIVTRLHADPADNIMSTLVREQSEDMLTEDELLANAVFLLAAGHETTTNLIANGILSLLRAPAELERLRAEPSLLPSAVEEILRFESPLQITGRIAKEDIEIGGATIARGQLIALVLGSANRDPACFDDPDRLDIGRRDNKHLAFSQGAHYCTGATLARIEGQIAIGSALRRLRGMKLREGRVDWHQNISFRGLRSLPVVFDELVLGEGVPP